MHAYPKKASLTGLLRCAVITTTLVMTPVIWAQDSHDHSKQESGDSKEADTKGGGMMKHGMMMGGKSMSGHGMSGCPDQEGMPPHYCAPKFKMSSAVPGVTVETVAPAGDRAVMVTLKELNVMKAGINQHLVIVAGGKDVAGAAVVKSGWKGNTQLHLNLTGNGSLYTAHHLYVKVFPVTTE